MDAAEHNSMAPGPQLVGDAIGAQRCAGDGRDADQVGLELEIQRLNASS
jgi:hypothetical protein